MTDLRKLKIASIITTSPFWIAIIVLYLNSRGITTPDVFKLISFYQFSVVLLEYPTGVIGDHFSHKASITLGFLFSSLGMLFATFQLSMIYYYMVMIIIALGVSLVSGSNTALLYKLSDDFKKDSASLKTTTMTWSLIALSLGGIIGKYSLVVPVYLTSISFFIGFLAMFSIKHSDHNKNTGNIFNKAKEGLVHIKNDNTLVSILVANALVSGIFLSTIWFYNPFFEALNINVSWWGILISFASLLSVVGVIVYKKIPSRNILWYYLFLIILFILTSFVSSKISIVALLALLLAHLVGGGYIQTFLEVDINNHLVDSTRASVISFGSLLIRLTSSLYIFVTGLILTNYNLPYLFIFTAILLTIIGLPLVIKIQNQSKNTIHNS